MKKLIESADVSLVEVPGKGRGVIAERDYATHEIVVTSPVVVIPLSETNSLFSTCLGKYVFAWPFDDAGGKITVKTPERCAMVVGLGSMVNHAETPNCDWDFLPEAKLHLLRASRYITAGEELCIDYGWTPEEMNGADPVSSLEKLEQLSVIALSSLGAEISGNDPCWNGYSAAGKKKKNGKWVPNCVKDGEEAAGEHKITSHRVLGLHRGFPAYPTNGRMPTKHAVILNNDKRWRRVYEDFHNGKQRPLVKTDKDTYTPLSEAHKKKIGYDPKKARTIAPGEEGFGD